MTLALQIILIILGVIFGIGMVAEKGIREKRFFLIAMAFCFILLLVSVKI